MLSGKKADLHAALTEMMAGEAGANGDNAAEEVAKDEVNDAAASADDSPMKVRSC